MKNKYKIFVLLIFSLLCYADCNVVSMSGKLPPGIDYREVSLQLRIMHIYDINLDHQTVKLSGYFRQSWNDSRMMGNQWDGITPEGRKFFLMNKEQALWLPDTFISNSINHKDRESFAGDPHGAYHYLRVYTDGEVLYSQMIDIMIKTRMNLKYYPFNVLNISLDVESYGYPDHTLRYSPGSSSNKDGLIIKIQNVPGYEINESLANSYLTTAEYSTGNFSKIEMSFSLIPNDSTLFILSIPNLLLIVISSFIFWMDIKKKLSERLSLGITAMLADFALSFSLPVPDTPDFLYVREYINISYIFIGFTIFFTFTEYVIVSFVHNVKRNNKNYKFPISRCINKLSNSPRRRNVNNNTKNMEESIYKLKNMNELMRSGLIDYIDSSKPEEPVVPIKAAIGIFYLSCWVSFMVGHIIPGKMIMDKAKYGINYHAEAVDYFPIIGGIGLLISLILSILAYFFQDRSRKKWKRDKENDKKENTGIFTNVKTTPEYFSSEPISCSLDKDTMDKFDKINKKNSHEHQTNFESNEISNRISNLSRELNEQIDQFTCTINVNLDEIDKDFVNNDVHITDIKQD